MSKPQFYPFKYQEQQRTTVDASTGEKTYEAHGRTVYGIVWTEPNGKVHKERAGLLTKTLARAAVEKKRKQAQDAQGKGFETVEGPKAAITLKQAAAEYIDAQRNETTKDDYQRKVDECLLPVMGNVILGSIKPADVMAYIEQRRKDGAAIGTIKKDLAVLSGIFSAAQIKEQADRNPVTLARKGKKKELKSGKKLLRWLNQDEEIRLFNALPPRKPSYVGGTCVNGSILRDAFPFSLMTGLRDREQGRLLWQDYDPVRRVIAIRKQKNGNQDELPLCDAAVLILERLRAEALREVNGTAAAIQKLAIFRDPETLKPLTRFNNTGWSKAKVKAGVDKYRWHDNRHTFASRMALAGVSLQRIQTRMRHASINQTLAYAHLCPEDNEAGAGGIDFKGRRDVYTLDCYQDYAALLGITPAHALQVLPGTAHREVTAHRTAHTVISAV